MSRIYRKRLVSQIISLVASLAAIISTSVVEVATTACHWLSQETHYLHSLLPPPVLAHPPKSASL